LFSKPTCLLRLRSSFRHDAERVFHLPYSALSSASPPHFDVVSQTLHERATAGDSANHESVTVLAQVWRTLAKPELVLPRLVPSSFEAVQTLSQKSVCSGRKHPLFEARLAHPAEQQGAKYSPGPVAKKMRKRKSNLSRARKSGSGDSASQPSPSSGSGLAAGSSLLTAPTCIEAASAAPPKASPAPPPSGGEKHKARHNTSQRLRMTISTHAVPLSLTGQAVKSKRQKQPP